MRQASFVPVGAACKPGEEAPSLLGRWTLRAEYTTHRTGIWQSVTAPNAPAQGLHQGWKLHVSARPDSFAGTLDRVVPIILDAGCDFKVIASPELLRELNAGLHGPSAVGKAVTIYPRGDTIVDVAHRLADALSGYQGPRILSDRRVRDDAPVYYRFGPIAPRLSLNDAGRLDILLEAPDGQTSSGLAGDRYVAPTWIKDPFERATHFEAELLRVDGELVMGDHYRVIGAITRSARGALYRAIDRRSGDRVIVKEARAYINETNEGDIRAYLRNERMILGVLDGISGVPRVVDHFAYGDDEFLVTTELGPTNLRNAVVDAGLFELAADSPRCVLALARDILAVLDAVHERGVVYRDLAPKNVVALTNGAWGLVDFELSSFAGAQRYGWTPGYSHARQRSNEPGSIADDYFSLGTTLFYALTGLDPIMIEDDTATNAAKTGECLGTIWPAGAPIVILIRNLLDSDPDIRIHAARYLRGSTAWVASVPESSTCARAPLDLAAIQAHTLRMVIEQASELVAAHELAHGLPPPITAYDGTAGIVMELVQHSDGLPAAQRLARVTAAVASEIESAPALLYGRLGIGLALQAAGKGAADISLLEASVRLMPNASDVASEQRVDVTHGIAGLGTGFLAAASMASEPEPYLALATQCAKRLLHGDGLIAEQLALLPVGNAVHGISVEAGFAHGRAGLAYFLLVHGAQAKDETSGRAALALCHALAELVPDLAARAAAPLARPMAASWCQGLAGIGTTLIRASRWFGDEKLLEAARTAAAGCRALAPRVPLVTQCCGLSAIGEYFLDLALVTGDSRYRGDALEILDLMLLRSGGSPHAPLFPDSSAMKSSPEWATGTSGVLSFLRRLITPETPRLWLADSWLTG